MPLILKSCTIRPWQLDDAESLAAHANNRKIWLALRDRLPHPYSLDDAHEFLRKSIAEEPVKNFCIEIDSAAGGRHWLSPR